MCKVAPNIVTSVKCTKKTSQEQTWEVVELSNFELSQVSGKAFCALSQPNFEPVNALGTFGNRHIWHTDFESNAKSREPFTESLR